MNPSASNTEISYARFAHWRQAMEAAHARWQLNFPAPHPPPELPREPVAEPLVGWRIWVVGYDGANRRFVLQGAHVCAPWTPNMDGVTSAVCQRSDTHACVCPEQNCSCGIYAWKRPHMYAVGPSPAREHFAYGTVELWGKVIEHKDGYRAQYARPLQITAPTIPAHQRAELAALYHCEMRQS